MNTISGDELAAVVAAFNLVMQPEEQHVERPSAWKLAARQESVMPFERLRVKESRVF